jgi:hypothetical protein
MDSSARDLLAPRPPCTFDPGLSERPALSSGLSRVAVGIGYATVAVSPLWDSDVAVFILSALLIAISAREYM